MPTGDEDVADVIDIGNVPQKYERTGTLLLGERLRPSTDLKILSKLRDEVIHFLPYTQQITARTVPDWLQYLEQQRLLISTRGPGDFHFSQKLSSYALAYWACETARNAAERFAAAAQHTNAALFLMTENFHVTAGLHAPNELHQFDRQHGLTLTQ